MFDFRKIDAMLMFRNNVVTFFLCNNVGRVQVELLVMDRTLICVVLNCSRGIVVSANRVFLGFSPVMSRSRVESLRAFSMDNLMNRAMFVQIDVIFTFFCSMKVERFVTTVVFDTMSCLFLGVEKTVHRVTFMGVQHVIL